MLYHTCFTAAASRRSDPTLVVPRMPPPIPPLPPLWWHPSCHMVAGRPRLRWETVLRDPRLRHFSSDSSLQWEPPSGPHLQVCQRLIVLGLCFTGWRIPSLPPSSLVGQHTWPQGLSSLLSSHSLPPPPLLPLPPLLGHWKVGDDLLLPSWDDSLSPRFCPRTGLVWPWTSDTHGDGTPPPLPG